MFAAITLAMTAQYTCKISILLFYRHIFFASDFHRDVSLGLMAFTSTWLISAIVALLRICRPLKLVWLPEEQHDGAKCGNWVAMVFSVLLVDVLTDVAILLLPIRTAFTLQMPLRAKIGVVLSSPHTSIKAMGGQNCGNRSGGPVCKRLICCCLCFSPHDRQARQGLRRR